MGAVYKRTCWIIPPHPLNYDDASRMLLFYDLETPTTLPRSLPKVLCVTTRHLQERRAKQADDARRIMAGIIGDDDEDDEEVNVEAALQRKLVQDCHD